MIVKKTEISTSKLTLFSVLEESVGLRFNVDRISSDGGLLLEAYNKGWDVSKYKYPVSAVRFNNDFTIFALTGEVVQDYFIAAGSRFLRANMFVSGFCSGTGS